MLRNGRMDVLEYFDNVNLMDENKRETLRIKILMTVIFCIAKLRNESNRLTPQTFKLI